MRRACLTSASSLNAVRCIIAGKSVVENRITKHYYNKSPEECRAEMNAQLDKHKVANPKNKKEALEHLTRNPNYEYTADFQRWANDMMAIYSDPVLYGHDMAYHYHRIWKVCNPSHRRCEDGNDVFDIVKIHPK